jgi:hypothetical protein
MKVLQSFISKEPLDINYTLTGYCRKSGYAIEQHASFLKSDSCEEIEEQIK